MQVDSNYGIIPDTQTQILNEYLDFFKDVFSNANSADDPAYVIATICALFDSKNEGALEVLSNAKNSNTASGIGLDILANTVLNLFRRSLTPSTCVLKIIVQNLLSYVDITIDVTVSSAQVIPVAWAVSGTVSPSPAYASLTTLSIPVSGIYTIRCYSTDTTTSVPIDAINAGAAVSGITFNSVANLGAATLGSVTIPYNWAITASAIPANPIYTPNPPGQTSQTYTYHSNGTYYILIYSPDILTNVGIGQLNTFTQINNVNPTPAGMIAIVTNLASNVLGKPKESDQQFAQRRRYYLNVEGQTYFGLEKVIGNIQAPALNSAFTAETISDTYASSLCIIKITVTVPPSSTVVVPVNWTVYGTATPTAPYKTNQSYTFTMSGTYYIPVFSTDETTAIPIGNFTSGDVISGVVVNGNLDPAIMQVITGLGQRGVTVYLNYPTNGPSGTFDLQDIYLQQIASAVFQYHPLGTQFYSGGAGATQFIVNSPYNGYTSPVYLTPLIKDRVAINLTLVYNVNPKDAGFSNGIFDYSLITSGQLQIQLLNLINSYFNSKTLPTDLVFSINELSELIQQQYTGIVALSSPTLPFTFKIFSPAVETDLLFMRRRVGYVFNIVSGDFHFFAVNKDDL